jgi:hypothetical protein
LSIIASVMFVPKGLVGIPELLMERLFGGKTVPAKTE